MIHDQSGATTLLPYGQREDEVIYSVGRAALNRVLIEEAARHQDVTIRFDQTCLGADPVGNLLRFRNEVSGAQYQVELAPTIATDGGRLSRANQSAWRGPSLRARGVAGS